MKHLMKLIPILVIVAALAVCSVPVMAAGEATCYYQNNFENDLDNVFDWTNWTVKSENGGKYASLVLPDSVDISKLELTDTYSGMDIAYRVRLDSINDTVDGNFGVSLRRANGGNDQLDVAYQAVAKKLRIMRYQNGAPTELGSKDYEVRTGEWILMGFRLNGTILEWYINGELMLSVTDDVLTEGTMLFAAYRVNISIDDVVVTAPDGIDMKTGKIIGSETPDTPASQAPATDPAQTQAPATGTQAPATQGTTPQTGDDASIVLWIAAAAFAMVCLTVVTAKKARIRK